MRHLKLMIVDDHAESRGLVRELLDGFADEIRECTNGEDAAAQYAEFRPDLVSMDLNMPLTDGLEATRKILAKHPTARVIVISDFDTAELRTAANRVGACQFFSKDNLTGLLQHLEHQHRR